MSTKTKTKSILECTCDLCGHTWEPREGVLPKVCVKCKSYNWNKSEEKKV
jgi:hypothetical protein